MSFFGKLKAKLFKSSSKLNGEIKDLIDEEEKEPEKLLVNDSMSDTEKRTMRKENLTEVA